MLFTDHFFLLYFFPIFFIAYILFGKKTHLSNIVIIFFSLLFYSSFGIQNIPILLIPLVLDYLLGIQLFRTKNKTRRKWIVGLVVALNLIFLGFFKYLDFVLVNTGSLFSPTVLTSLHTFKASLIIPVGISFITFQRISYIVDIYRKKTGPEYNFISYSTYATVFPHLIAGPIVRYSAIKKQLVRRMVNSLTLFEGMKWFISGMVLKVLIADQLYRVEVNILDTISQIHSLEAFILIFYFSLRIYTDFAGYSLMAVGLAKCMGFDFPQNFFAPYRSNNITTFWKRWNMTLSSWLRDYVYIPLGGNRKGRTRTYVNLLLTMLLGGLWHGPSWNFVMWGGLHGFYLATERFLADKHISIKVPSFLQITFTFFLVSITWLTFLFTNPSDIFKVLEKLVSFTYHPLSTKLSISILWSIPSFIGALIWSFLLSEEVIAKIKPSPFIVILMCVLFIYTLGISLLNTSVPFIYFQF